MSTRQNIVFCGLIVLLAVVSIAQSRKMVTITEAVKYLSRFGYLPPSVLSTTKSAIQDESGFTSALQNFQRFFGLEETGKLDDATTELMSKPRCGVQDMQGYGNKKRWKRYNTHFSKWNTTILTYRVTKYTEQLAKADVDAQISRAFAVWSEQIDINFVRVTAGDVAIEIRFENGEHGDGSPFDDIQELGHTFFPKFGGDVHFNNAERWTIDSFDGVNLFQVAVHEFGHALGLMHSNVVSAAMYPYYRGYKQNYGLHYDDIVGIESMYGKKSLQSDVPRTAPIMPRHNEFCKDSKIDTIFNSAEGQTYVLKGNNYYLLTQNSVADGYPKPIHSRWPGLPNNIDAAFTYKNGLTHFYKGTKYWVYNGNQIVNGYPKEIKTISRFIPNNMDAAMFRRDLDAIYFYKDDTCTIYFPTEEQISPNQCNFPVAFAGKRIDAAFQGNDGHMYFFKDNNYYADFFNMEFGIFPRPSSTIWFGCKSSFFKGLDWEAIKAKHDAWIESAGFPRIPSLGMPDFPRIPSSGMPEFPRFPSFEMPDW